VNTHTYIEELMERCPDDAVVHRHVDDVGLTVHVLTTLRQKTHPDLQQSPPYHSTVADSWKSGKSAGGQTTFGFHGQNARRS